MKGAVRWLIGLWRGPSRARDVATAYRIQLDPRDPAARLVLADLAHYGCVGTSSFVPGDPHQTALNEGRRDMFNHIAEILRLEPQDFPDLLEEPLNG